VDRTGRQTKVPVEIRLRRTGHLFLCAVVILGLLGCDRGASSGAVSGSTRGETVPGSTQSESGDAPAVTFAAPPQAAFVYSGVLEQALEDA
jgi:hypothetical protein